MDLNPKEIRRSLWCTSAAIVLDTIVAHPSHIVTLLKILWPIFLVASLELVLYTKRLLPHATDSRACISSPLEEVNLHTPAQNENDPPASTFAPAPLEESDSHSSRSPEDTNSIISVLLEEAVRNSSNTNTVPGLESINLTHRLDVGEFRDRGGFSDVYEGLLSANSNDVFQNLAQTRVAVKVFRIYTSGRHIDDLRNKMRSFAREMIIWTSLQHNNVLPCLGFAEHNALPALISEWMENGNVIAYLAKNASVDRVEVAKGMALGLEYIHGEGIVHSDLKGANILVNSAGVPKLSDFGISRLVRDDVTVTGTVGFNFSPRWLAFELIEPSNSTGTTRLHTKKTDVWALGMVLYEILTLKLPFYSTDDVAVISVIASRKLPEEPTESECSIEDWYFLWEICTQCWTWEPDSRLTATDVSRLLSVPRPFTTFLIKTVKPDPDFRLRYFKTLDLTSWFEHGQLRVHSGSTDVFDASLEQNGRQIRVLVKLFHLSLCGDDGDKLELLPIARILNRSGNLTHRNVLPWIGFAEIEGRPALVREWTENGNLIEFLANYDDVDRLKMAKGIARGLGYLHENGIVHSDLKGANILISSKGEPTLCDFGISRMVKDGVMAMGTDTFKFNINWLAIELIISTDSAGSAAVNGMHTMKSDIWAMGMVFYELLTLKKPFYGSNEFFIPTLIASGNLPTKPTKEECSSDDLDEIWEACLRCWEKNPDNRPTATEICRTLGNKFELSKIQEVEAHSDWVYCVAFSPAFSPVDAKTLASASSDDTVCIWTLLEDGKTSTLRHRLSDHTHWVRSIAWSGDGLFLVSGSYDHTIRKWNISTGECELTIETPIWVYAVVLSPDNKHVVSGHEMDSSIYVWDVSTGGRILGPLIGHTNSVVTVVYSPDGRRILSGSTDGSVIVWDSTTGEVLFGPFTAHSVIVQSISFHPSGKTFVTGSYDETLTIWDAKDLKPIHKNIHVHSASVSSVQYSPDGALLLSASYDGTLRLSDTNNGKQTCDLVQNGCNVHSATFSPDGRWVASGGVDGKVRIWEVRDLVL